MRGDRLLERLKRLEAEGLPLSRNRSFEVFSDDLNRSALRYQRRLKALGRAIRAADRVVFRREPEGDVVVRLTDRRARYRHTIYLAPDEAAWLVRHDRSLQGLLGTVRT